LKEIQIAPGQTTLTSMSMQTPILGFGCARLTANNSVNAAISNLSTAYSHGIRYFDTARLYGYGRAEAILGNFIRDKRDKVVITTKAGLKPREVHGLIGLGMLNLVRKGVRSLNALRKSPAPGNSPLIGQRITSSGLLRQSLERSLRELRTEYVDIFLLHELTIDEANRDEVVRLCEDVIREGKVLRVGLGSESCRDMNEDALRKVYTLAQHEYDLFHGILYNTQNIITHSVHGVYRLSKRITDTINDPEFFNHLQDIVEFDVTDKSGLHKVMLKCAQVHNASGIVLFASSGNDKISETANVWQSPGFTPQQVNLITELFRKYTVRI
jgi:aryl-alcohol dehydrogenase-like predicted oxidoreductase